MIRYPSPLIGDRLNTMKRNLCLSDTELAKLCGTERRTVLGWRRGVGRIPAEAIRRICQTYHVSADWILGLTDEGEPQFVDVPDTARNRNIRIAGGVIDD